MGARRFTARACNVEKGKKISRSKRKRNKKSGRDTFGWRSDIIG